MINLGYNNLNFLFLIINYMSGHSKWSTIKRKKGVTDAKRGAIFTKIGKLITVAARNSDGDPNTNFSLRLAIDKAKAVNMPKENIERSIVKGMGTDKEGAQIEEITYEAYAPGGIAMLIKTLTDNRNRTASEIKHLLSQHGGSLGTPGSVVWQFKERGVIRITKENFKNYSIEDIEMKSIDLGAEDILIEEEGVTILTTKEKFAYIKSNIEKMSIIPDSLEIEQIATNTVNTNEKDQEKIKKLCAELDEHDDVDSYFHNGKF